MNAEEYRKDQAKWERRRKRIIKLHNLGVKQAELARIYGISRQRVLQIIESEKRR